LPSDASAECKAAYVDGVLSVTIPKLPMEQRKAKTISIS
jgi:HSP20 family molecular chaperone IbpA